MSQITIVDITKIARLSRIEVAADKKPQLAEQLTSIIGWVENLNEVDTKNVEPLFSVNELNLRMEKDQINAQENAEDVLKNAPDAKYNYFTVPKMIE